jgi:hypothetical protein
MKNSLKFDFLGLIAVINHSLDAWRDLLQKLDSELTAEQKQILKGGIGEAEISIQKLAGISSRVLNWSKNRVRIR